MLLPHKAGDSCIPEPTAAPTGVPTVSDPFCINDQEKGSSDPDAGCTEELPLCVAFDGVTEVPLEGFGGYCAPLPPTGSPTDTPTEFDPFCINDQEGFSPDIGCSEEFPLCVDVDGVTELPLEGFGGYCASLPPTEEPTTEPTVGFTPNPTLEPLPCPYG